VSHLVCGGVYDGSTGLIYRDGRYFDPALGIWLALLPLMVVQSGRKRKDKNQWCWHIKITSMLLLVCLGGTLTACGNKGWETLDDSLVCTDMPDDFVPTDRTSHNVKIVDYKGPEIHLSPGPGEPFFGWYVYFEVNRDSGDSGHIIQEVNHDHETYRENGALQSRPEPPLRYWEAWSVDQDEIHTQSHIEGEKWDDLFMHHGNPANSRGFHENTSIVRFYEGGLPDHFALGNVRYAGSTLLSSETAPDFWEYKGTAHTFTLEWDLTGDKDNWWWKYTVRRGDHQRSETWGNVKAAMQGIGDRR
jgi:predicted small lipoprotein YifL